MCPARSLCLLLAVPLMGCLTDGLPGGPPTQAQLEARRAELAVKDDEICKSYGARPGTDIYIQCRMQQVQQRDATDNAAMIAAAASTPVVINNTVRPPSYPIIQNTLPPGPRCTSRGPGC
jgi:hypothetical protein